MFMLSNPKSVSELEHEYWLVNLVFSMDLTAHLNELNRHPQCETQLNNVMLQIITAVPMKQKHGKLNLWNIITCISTQLNMGP